MKQHPNEMRESGYVIDDTCYPWVAYKGPRFAPTVSHWCYTDLESNLQSKMTNIELFLNGMTTSNYTKMKAACLKEIR